MHVVARTAGCFSCGRSFTFCPLCVTVVAIDPATNRPPDVTADNEWCKPDSAAVARSVARPLCVPCTKLANAQRPPGRQITTETERHERHVGHPATCRVIA